MFRVVLVVTLVALSLGFRLQRKELRSRLRTLSRGLNHGPMSIVGGYEAFEGDVPWQVSLKNGEYNHFCGGSLVDTKDGNMAIVTAAHCIIDTKPSDTKVVVGRHSLTTPSSIERTFQVKSITMHPRYDYDTNMNDIAILFVEGKIEWNELGISPIKMTDRDVSSFVGTKCLISGWGALKEGEGGPDRLQEAFVDVFSDEYCKQSYAEFNSTNMMCAGKKDGKIDTCQGDSGGPLACDNGEEFLLVGVVSFGDGCARPGKPGVYADVNKLKSWLLRELGFSI